MGRRKRRRVDPTHEWEQIELLCAWEEQRGYERIRPLVLFGEPASERSAETGASEGTLYRRIAAFGEHGMESLFGSPKAKRRVLPPAIRRKIVDLKAEHPPLNLEEIANVCGVLFGRRPDGHTVKAVLEESAIPRKLVRRFEPYHEADDVRESREAVVTLHREGWSDKSIARYLKVDRSTVYRVRRRFEEEGEEGLEDRPGGRPRGVAKVDLRAMNEVRKMQENPELGEFGVHAALERMGIRLSSCTVGRILKANREAEGGGRRPGETLQGTQGEAGDALRGVIPPPVLDLRRTLHSALHPRDRAGLCHGDPRELFAGDPRKRPDALAGHERLPLRAARGHRTLRLAGGHRHRRRRDLPLEPGEGHIPGVGHT